MLRLACSICLAAALNCSAQEMAPANSGGDGFTWNQEFLRLAHDCLHAANSGRELPLFNV